MALNKEERLKALSAYVEVEAASAEIVALLAADAPIFQMVLKASALRGITEEAFNEFFEDVKD